MAMDEMELEEWLEPDFYPKMPDDLEDDVDEAFVDGIIAMAEGVLLHENLGKGRAWQHGFRFAERWGERGKDLGLALKGMRQDARKKSQP